MPSVIMATGHSEPITVKNIIIFVKGADSILLIRLVIRVSNESDYIVIVVEPDDKEYNRDTAD